MLKKGDLKSAVVLFLENLAASFEILGSSFISKKAAYRNLYYGGSNYSRDQFSRKVSNLTRHGYLEKDANHPDSFRFTNKAKLKIIEKLVPRKDGVHRFISFDIPEAMSTKRNQFRKTIKRLGFRQIQQSLWVIDHDVSELIELAAREYGVENYIIYIVSSTSDIDGYIKKKLEK
ncbi:MAG: hypothetical protein WCG48_01740 [Candidatus Berkelbacteria bacterium]